MHASNPNATPAIPVLASPARGETEQNGTFRNTNDENALPIFTPASPQLPTTPPPHPSPLSPRQLSAISLLCSGLNLDTVAARLRIGRTTLYTWRTTHPAFRAELARRQKELRDTASRRLRLTLLRALAAVTDQITSARHREDRAKTALALLRSCDLRALLADSDPLTPAACLDDLIQQDRASRNLEPTLAIDDDDRAELLARLESDHTFDAPPPATPTHRRLAGARHTPPSPYPAPANDTPDPDFQV